jgi:hypothetical protein
MSGSCCSRRQAIRSIVGGSMLFPGLLRDLLADGVAAPHHAPRAKRAILLYMTGGVSHLESFDWKPKLAEEHGKTLAPEAGHGRRQGRLSRPIYPFARHGCSGIEVSSIFPEVAKRADDLCVIRSMRTDHDNHPEATLGMHTGSFGVPRPSLGSWVSYGLGSPNRNLPSFVVLCPQLPWGGSRTWAADFLPGVHQGLRIFPGAQPVPDLRRGAPGSQEAELAFLESMNRAHLEARDGDPKLLARIRSFETAYGMQAEASEAFDVGAESDETHALYGVERGSAKGYGWQCLAARRLVERGVRFVECVDTGAGATTGFVNWDAHQDLAGHAAMAKNVDRPIAGLLQDLKQRGLLEDTLVVWATEFGRTPWQDGADGKGRAHHPKAFTCWLAGGGVKAGHVHGRTDELGAEIVEDPVHVHDFHATILHLLGMDHTRLTYRYAGRDFRLTDVHGRVVSELLA